MIKEVLTVYIELASIAVSSQHSVTTHNKQLMLHYVQLLSTNILADYDAATIL